MIRKDRGGSIPLFPTRTKKTIIMEIGDIVRGRLNSKSTSYYGEVVTMSDTLVRINSISQPLKKELVTVCHDYPKIGNIYGNLKCYSEHFNYRGKTVKLKGITKNGTYYIENCDYTFSKEMFNILKTEEDGENKNRLQNEKISERRDKPEGIGIHGRRSKASITIRHLSNKERHNEKSSSFGRCEDGVPTRRGEDY